MLLPAPGKTGFGSSPLLNIWAQVPQWGHRFGLRLYGGSAGGLSMLIDPRGLRLERDQNVMLGRRTLSLLGVVTRTWSPRGRAGALLSLVIPPLNDRARRLSPAILCVRACRTRREKPAILGLALHAESTARLARTLGDHLGLRDDSVDCGDARTVVDPQGRHSASEEKRSSRSSRPRAKNRSTSARPAARLGYAEIMAAL